MKISSQAQSAEQGIERWSYHIVRKSRVYLQCKRQIRQRPQCQHSHLMQHGRCRVSVDIAACCRALHARCPVTVCFSIYVMPRCHSNIGLRGACCWHHVKLPPGPAAVHTPLQGSWLLSWTPPRLWAAPPATGCRSHPCRAQSLQPASWPGPAALSASPAPPSPAGTAKLSTHATYAGSCWYYNQRCCASIQGRINGSAPA